MKRKCAALMLMLVAFAGTENANAAEKPKLKLLEQRSAVSSSDCIHELVLAGGSVRRIEDPGCTAVLSPDGKWVALRSHGDMAGLVLYDTAKDAYTATIAFYEGTDVGQFVWSPDGCCLAFTTVNQDAPDYPTKSKLFIYTVATQRKTKMDVQAFRSCGAACIASTPEWSPDGKRIKLVEVDREKMLAGRDRFERDVEFDRNGSRLSTSAWR